MTYPGRAAQSAEERAAASAGGEQKTITTPTKDEGTPASATPVVECGPAGSAHEGINCFAGVEEQLAANNCAISARSIDARSSLRPSDPEIVISRRWDGVFSASRTPEDDGICIARPQNNRQERRASQPHPFLQNAIHCF
jgi:hypothetical protein